LLCLRCGFHAVTISLHLGAFGEGNRVYPPGWFS
jgi:hypothetical protein